MPFVSFVWAEHSLYSVFVMLTTQHFELQPLNLHSDSQAPKDACLSLPLLLNCLQHWPCFFQADHVITSMIFPNLDMQMPQITAMLKIVSTRQPTILLLRWTPEQVQFCWRYIIQHCRTCRVPPPSYRDCWGKHPCAIWQMLLEARLC